MVKVICKFIEISNFQVNFNPLNPTAPEFETLEKKYQPYLDLHGIGEIFGVFDIKQGPPR